MPEKTYVITQIVGVSDQSISQATANAIALKALDWFEVKEVRGTIQSGTVHEYQVTLDVGFRYLSDDEMRDWLKG